jgi:hypothetical protein
MFFKRKRRKPRRKFPPDYTDICERTYNEAREMVSKKVGKDLVERWSLFVYVKPPVGYMENGRAYINLNGMTVGGYYTNHRLTMVHQKDGSLRYGDLLHEMCHHWAYQEGVRGHPKGWKEVFGFED